MIWHLCIANMKKRGIRTGLTILGVVIGVISVVSMLGLGLGVKRELLSEATLDGSVTEISVMGVTEGKRKDRMLTDRRIEDISEIPHIEDVTPMLTAGVSMYYGKYVGYNELTGVPRKYLESLPVMYGNTPEVNGNRLEILMGAGALYMFYNDNTGITYAEAKAPTKEEQEELDRESEKNDVEINGKKSWNDLSDEYVDVYIGNDEVERNLHLQVSGMLPEYRYEAFCDMDTLKKQLKRNAAGGVIEGQPTDSNGNPINEWVYSNAIVKVDDVSNVDTVVKRLSDMGYQAESNKEYVDEIQREIKIIQLLLGGIGAIALVVAVIGIGNTMTTSVYDRIGEIGILKVLGCDPDELMGLFLLESGILGGIGGVIGLACSFVIVKLIINRLGIKLLKLSAGTELAVLPLWLCATAVIMAIVLGIVAGYLPAKWASKLKPIDAVRMN